MATAACLPIAADRVGPCVRTIFFEGLDLFGLQLAMEFRLNQETPGPAPISLGMGATADAEGIRVVDVTSANGIPTSQVVIRISEATMKDAAKVPYSGELGSASTLFYDFIATFGQDRRRLAYGTFTALPTVYGMDSAPANRPQGGQSGQASTWTNARVTYSDDDVRVVIDGADLLGLIIDDAREEIDGGVAAAQAARLGAEAALAAITARDLDPLEFDRSGYLEATIDERFRIIKGVSRATLSMIAVSYGGQLVEDLGSLEYERSGAVDALVDSDFTLLELTERNVGLDHLALDPLEYDRSGYLLADVDGSWRVVAGTRPVPASAPVAADAADYIVVEQTDAAGRRQVYSERRSTGARMQLSPAGSNNTLVRVERGNALYRSDRARQPAGGLFAVPVAGGAEVSVLPYLAIVMWGDSQVGMGADDGTGAGLVAAQKLGWAYANQWGVGGQSAQQTASRLAGVRMIIVGGQIPAAAGAGVNVLILGADPITGGQPNIKVRYSVAGVLMTLTRDTNGTGAYTLTRDSAGAAVAVPSSVFARAVACSRYGSEDPVDIPRDCVTIIQVSRNGFDTIEANVAAIRDLVSTLSSLSKRFVIPLVLPVGYAQDGSVVDPIEPTGSERRLRIEAMNAAIKAAFPDNSLDLLPILQARGDGSAGDNADIAAGFTPRSLRTDFLHLNAAGRSIAGQYGYAPLITAKGWTQA